MYICPLSLQPSWRRRQGGEDREHVCCLCIHPQSMYDFGTFSIAGICEEMNYCLCHLVSEILPENGNSIWCCWVPFSTSLFSPLPFLGSIAGFVFTSVSCSFSCFGVSDFKKQYQFPLTHSTWAKFFIWPGTTWLILTFIWSFGSDVWILFCFVLMRQWDAQSCLMSGNEEVPGPFGLWCSWQCHHGKCFCEMDMGHEAQALLGCSKAHANEQMGWLWSSDCHSKEVSQNTFDGDLLLLGWVVTERQGKEVRMAHVVVVERCHCNPGLS